MEPTEYDLLERKRKAIAEKDLKRLQRWTQRLQTFLHENGFASATVELRPRHLHGIYDSTKAQIALLQHVETFYRVYVITKKQEGCYRMLNYLHQFSSSLPNHIIDYIAHPKTNRYRAIHTTVMSSLGNPIKIIIQTKEMDQEGLFGAALPYQQKTEKPWKDLPPWIGHLISLDHDTKDLPHFFRAVQSEILGERCRVHVVGEKQKFIDLPCHASMLDVAFYASDKVGMYAKHAIVNSEPMNLKRIIQDGDVIEFEHAKSKFQRTAEDLAYIHTSTAQKLLIDHLSALSKKELYGQGEKIISHTLDVTMDPFLSTSWKKGIAKRLYSNKKDVEHIGSGVLDAFDLLNTQCLVSDFFLIDPRLFQFTSRLTPKQKMRFVLRTSLDQLRRKNVIGQQIRPDVIDILSIDDVEERKHAHTKELVPLTIESSFLLRHPFYFSFMWSFRHGSNPLKTIANIQNLLDTPIELLEFNRSSLMLGFHTDRIGTLHIVYEYLYSQSDISRIVRISP